MVTNMSDTKDPHQENKPVDLDDDDDIIELTEEVIIPPKKDGKIADLLGSGTAAPKSPSEKPLKTDEKEPEADVDEDDTIDLSGAPEFEQQGTVLNLDEAFADADTNMGEDDIIASAIEESLGADDDEPELAEDRIKLMEDDDADIATDADLIKLSAADDEPTAVSDAAAAAADTDEGVFQAEEEIELKAESSEDEYDFFDLDDNNPLEELETTSMADEEAIGSGDDDASVDPLAELDFGTDEDDDIIAMDTETQEEAELMAFDDDETLEFESAGDLPDLTDEIEFDFDDDTDENGLADVDDDAADDSDDIIARAVEKSIAPDEVTAPIDLPMEPEFEFTEDNGSATMAEDDGGAAEEVLTAKTAEELRKLAEADDLDDIDEDADLEFENEDEKVETADIGDLESEVETMALEDLEAGAVEEDDEIIEITEFDEHFPEEDERKLAHAGVLDASDEDEDDFLELIEVEEDEKAEHEEVIAFGKSESQTDEDQIDSFFSETLADEPVFENEEMEPIAEAPTLSTDMAMATAPSASRDEEFDFSLDSSEISQQVDRLGTFLAEDLAAEPTVASLPSEPEMASHPSEPPAEEETPDEDQPPDASPAEGVTMTSDQIDAVVERVIKEKFGGNIETIIYEVIQKAVSKEIDRLKGALLSGAGSSQDEDD